MKHLCRYQVIRIVGSIRDGNKINWMFRSRAHTKHSQTKQKFTKIQASPLFDKCTDKWEMSTYALDDWTITDKCGKYPRASNIWFDQFALISRVGNDNITLFILVSKFNRFISIYLVLSGLWFLSLNKLIELWFYFSNESTNEISLFIHFYSN